MVTRAPRSVLSPRQFLLQPCLPFRPAPALSHPLLQGKGPCAPAPPSISRWHGAPAPGALISLLEDRNSSTDPCGDSPPWAVQVRGCSTSGFVSILEFVFKLRHHVIPKLPCHSSHELPPPLLGPQHLRVFFLPLVLLLWTFAVVESHTVWPFTSGSVAMFKSLHAGPLPFMAEQHSVCCPLTCSTWSLCDRHG